MRADQGKKYIRDLFLGLNREMDLWDKKGLSSNNLNIFKDMIKDFYEKNNMKVKNKERFSWQKNMTEEQSDELFDIAYSMGMNPYTDISTYEDMMNGSIEEFGTQDRYDTINMDAFKKITEQYGQVNTMQDYIDFIDRMNNFKNNALLSSILDSDQVAELYSLGHWADLDAATIDNLIAVEYSMTGKTKDRLYQTILEAIESYDEETGDFITL